MCNDFDAFYFVIFSIQYFRWKSGVASSLNYINIDSKETNPKLIPYPSWNSNSLKSDGFSTAESAGGRTSAPKATVVDDGQLADNSSIISTFRIRVDECDRLWVMDTGLVDILGNPKQIAPPALVIFDLKTNKLIKRYTIPGAHIKDDTFFANVVRFFETFTTTTTTIQKHRNRFSLKFTLHNKFSMESVED